MALAWKPAGCCWMQVGRVEWIDGSMDEWMDGWIDGKISLIDG